MFKFISHSFCPEDQYTKEIAIIEFPLTSGAIRVPYCLKETKDGKKFWSPLSMSINMDGSKQYIHPDLDSKFLENDIKAFLNARSWEQKAAIPGIVAPLPNTSYLQEMVQGDLFDPGNAPF